MEEMREPGFTGDCMILDEVAGFMAQHLCASDAQIDAMTLYAAATHALSAFPAFGRLLLTSDQEASGKTLAMTIVASLSANPLDASGTSYALQSALAAAANTPEQPAPTLYLDEISDVFGRSGLNASRNPVAEVLRKGYKKGATRAWSVNRTSEIYSIYTPFIVCGLRVAVPRDIRSRSIAITMRAGTPQVYFDTREAEPYAGRLADTLRKNVSKHFAELAAFRGRGIHPRLRDRKLEIWEPLFAVAKVLGGQSWVNRALASFKELALSESDSVALTPRQEIIRDAAQVTADSGLDFIGGLVLVDEMSRLDNPVYQSRSDASLARLVSDALPVNTVQRRVDGVRVRGYYASDILAAWEAIRPEDPDDAEIPEEENPFAVTGDDSGETEEFPAQQGVTGGTGEMEVAA
jgi:Protein of unknown function (DUF3631)